jgi:hypothetical protein
MPILNRFPAEFVANISSELRALVKAINYEYFCLVNFELAGKKVFRFEGRLLSELAQTSSNVLCDFVHLPFKTCLFVCQSTLMVNAIQRFESGTSADADLLKTIEGCDYETPVSIFVTELPADNKYEHPILSILVIQSDEQVMRSFCRRTLLLDPSISVEQALKTDWEKEAKKRGISEDNFIAGGAYGTGKFGEVNSATFFTDGLLLFRIVVNMLLYVSSTDPDLLPGHDLRVDADHYKLLGSQEKKNLRKLKYSASELPYLDVGTRLKTISIDGQSHVEGNINSVDTGRGLSVQFRVRAHWRNQRFGIGRSEVRRTWIREHMKGPDTAELVNSNYFVRLH